MTATMTKAPLFTVLRGAWIAEGVEREKGEIIDTSAWTRQQVIKSLVNSRYLDIFDKDHITTTCECGRIWDSPESAELHRCPERNSTPPEEPVTGPTAEAKVAKPRKPRVRKEA